MVRAFGCYTAFARCARSWEASQFSPVESFITVLRKLAAEDFASENPPRRSAIRRQIKSLLKLPQSIILVFGLATEIIRGSAGIALK